MSSFLNTEQTYSNSGTSAIWLAPNTSMLQSKNSGGAVAIAGPVLVKAIYVTRVSGFVGAGTSGVSLVVSHSVSGTVSGGAAATGDILFYHYGGGSGIITDPAPLVGIDFLARSGINTWVGNSGFTYAYTLNVLYSNKQA